MSWRIQITEARPLVDRLTPKEAGSIIRDVEAHYKKGQTVPLAEVQTHVPGLYAMYETVQMMAKAGEGRFNIREDALDGAWRRLAGFWPNVDMARACEDPQVRAFANHVADAVRDALPQRHPGRS